MEFGSNLGSEANTLDEINAHRALQTKSVSRRTASSIIERLDSSSDDHHHSMAADAQNRAAPAHDINVSEQLAHQVVESSGEEDEDDDDGEEINASLDEAKLQDIRSFMLGSRAYNFFGSAALTLSHKPYQERIMAVLESVSSVPVG